MSWYLRSGKRWGDLAIVVPGLVLCSPVLLGVAAAVRLTMGAPVLFRQQRPGLHGRPFELLKFRTMKDLRDADGRPLPDAMRLTEFGRWLRRSSLDELPELLNVLRGEMSLVGPRPLLMQYLDRYIPEQARRHEVRPGLTGYAQVKGRNRLSWNERFRLDVWYVDHASAWLDLEILLRTIVTVLRSEGITSEGHASMPEFMGAEAPGA